MATIVLSAAGGALGGIVGGPLGIVAGRALGGLAGRAVDERLFARRQSVEGARLTASRILDAEEGAGIARLYGTARIAGQVIWMTRFEETRNVERRGGKGGGGAAVESVTYEYFGNVAIGLCEGPIAHVRRIWADGEEMDLAEIEFRVHGGGEDQAPDPLIEAKQGPGNAPAYRGLAYVVFERLPLARWGNRIPQIACEVIRPIGELETRTRAITIIPGANEHGLDPVTVRERIGAGEDRLPNRNIRHDGNDFQASLAELTALCPNLQRAALVVAWFADDLRAGHASVRPGVEVVARDESERWRVQGLARDEARLISRSGGGPAYGGTPSDAGVVRCIAALRAAGLAITYYPFLLMDVAAENTLPDPYGAPAQAPYPWRGRMSLDLAEGMAGTADGSPAARVAIAAFVGTATLSDFSIDDGEVAYAGPAEWSYRRMILHQAFLAELAGGVEAFVIGSEMRGLTRLRDETGRFPFVEALIALARDIKAILPGAKVTYAADWSEYFGYQPADGSGDVFYNLDPLWADDAIDMVGIDNYLPLADWRVEDWEEGGPDGLRSPYDRAGLATGIAGGEHHDWFYASEADRRARLRTPITDGAGKPWVYRAKDLLSWWLNPHVERRGGVETGASSPWVPKGKPIWLTELGCPAIDKGANQPNVFVDPKSSESAFPHSSTGARDDHQQRRFLEAHLAHWAEAGNNPLSPVYGGPMVEADAIHLWTWDTRPYPAFPQRSDIWRDGSNWERGHWLTGRFGKAPLDRLMAAILRDHGFHDFDVSAVDGEVGGYLLQGPGSARGEIEELMRLAGIGAHSSAGRLVFRSSREAGPAAPIDIFAEEDDGPWVEIRRAEASETPQEFVVGYSDAARAYAAASASVAMASTGEARKATIELPVILDESEARRFAGQMLADSLGGWETARLAVSPTALALEPGDRVEIAGTGGRWTVTRIEDGLARRIEVRRLPQPGRETADEARGETRPPIVPPPVVASRPEVRFLDLPDEGGVGAWVGVQARPWLAHEISASATQSGFARRASASRPATMGRLAADLAIGPEAVVDHGNAILVDLFGGALASTSDGGLLAGANLCAIRALNDEWELVQFATVEEMAPMRFRLTGLLRALRGSEAAMAAGAPTGSTFVLLNEALVRLPIEPGEIGLALNWRVTPAGRALDDPATHAEIAALGLRAERPLSPVHLKASFAADGAATMSWIRRTRIGGDRWDGLDVPLGEEAERYLVRIRDEAGMMAEIETAAPSLTLSAERQVELFGALPQTIRLEVGQFSLTSGRGGVRARAFHRP